MTSSLSEAELSELKKELQRRFDQLRKEAEQELLASNNERYVQLAGRVHDRGDESVADLLTDVNLAVMDKHIREIQDVEAALMRMGKGIYGVCIDCRGMITYPRLQAYPTAKRCYECQARYEKIRNQLSHPRL